LGKGGGSLTRTRKLWERRAQKDERSREGRKKKETYRAAREKLFAKKVQPGSRTRKLWERSTGR